MKQNKIPLSTGRLSESKSRPSVSISIDERLNETPPPPDDIIEQMVRRPSQIPRKSSFASHLPRRKDSDSLASRIHTPSLLKRSKADDKVSWKDRIMGKRGSESRSKSKDWKAPPLMDMSEKDKRLIPDDVPPPGAHTHGDHVPGSPPPKGISPVLKPGTPSSGKSSTGSSASGKLGAGKARAKRPSTGIPGITTSSSGALNVYLPNSEMPTPAEEKGRTLTVRNPSFSDTSLVQEIAKEEAKAGEKPSEEKPREKLDQQPEQKPEQKQEEKLEQTPEAKLEKPNQRLGEKSEERVEKETEEEFEEKREDSIGDQGRTMAMDKVDENLKEMEAAIEKLRENGHHFSLMGQEEAKTLSPVEEIESLREDDQDMEEEEEKDPWHLEGRVSSHSSMTDKQDQETPPTKASPASSAATAAAAPSAAPASPAAAPASPAAAPASPSPAPPPPPPPPVAENKISRMSDSSTSSVASSLQSFLGDNVELNLDDDDSDKDDDHHVHTEDCDSEECYHHMDNHTSWNWATPPTPPIALQPAPPPRPSIVLSQPPSRSSSLGSSQQQASAIPHKVASALKANAVSMRRPSRPDNPWSWKLPAPDPSAPKINTVIVRRPSRLDHNTNSFGVWKPSGLSPTSPKNNAVLLQRPSIPEDQMWEPETSPMTTTFPRQPITHDSPTLDELSRPRDSLKSNGSLMSSGSPVTKGTPATNGSPAVQRSSLSNEFNKSNESPMSNEYSMSNESLALSEYSDLEEFTRMGERRGSDEFPGTLRTDQLTGSNKLSGFSRLSDSPTLSDPPRFSASSVTGELPKPIEVPRPNQQPPRPYQPPKLSQPPPRPSPPSPLQKEVLEIMGKQMMRRPSRPEDALNSHPVHVRQDSAIDLCRLCHSGVAESWGVCQKCEEMTPAALQPFSGGLSEKKGRENKDFRPPPIDVVRARNMSTVSYASSYGSDLTTPTTGSSTEGEMPHRLRPSLTENIIDKAALLDAVSPPLSPNCRPIHLDDPVPSDFEDAGNPFDMSPEERDHFEGIPRGISNRFGGSPDTESHYEVAPDDQSHYDVSPDASGDNYDVAPDDTSHYDVSPDARDRLEASPDAKPSLEVPSAAGSNFEISSTAGSRTSTLPALPTPAVLARYRIDTDRSDRSDRGSRDRDDSKDDVYEDWADYYFDAENFEAAKNRPRTKSAQTREAAQGYMARELSLDEYDGFWENPMSPGPGWI